MAPPTRDFAKRPKAKVGKRAPAKINATDTSFKTASVGVRPQGQSLDKNKPEGKDAASSAAARMELASSRGNALSTLQQSLRHHAPAVRASGLKGIRDAVQSLSSLEDTLGTSILEANLPQLLPNMCRCWLDEDDDVRTLAVQLFGDILKNLSSSSEQSDLKCLAPFVPFLCAYASSALNSLDRSVRKDGALVVGMLASSDYSPSFSSLTASSSGDKEAGKISAMAVEMGKYVDLFIPSMERLLSSMSLGGRGRNTKASSSKDKKRKRDGKNTVSQPTGSTLAASDATLLSLGLLLQASLASYGNATSSNAISGNIKQRLDPSLYVSGECTFLKGGSARANSLLLFREVGTSHKESNSPVRSIFDIPFMPIDEPLGTQDTHDVGVAAILRQSSPTESDTSTQEKIQRMTSLLETLRMKFVELTHNGRKSDNDKDGLMMSTADLETMDVLVQTIQFVHRLCQSYQRLVDQQELSKKISTPVRRQPRGKKAAAESQDIGECLTAYRKTVTKTLTLLLETFPICSMDGASISRYELTNAGICSALAELGGFNVLEGSQGGSSAQWISSVFSYILPRLSSTNGTEEDSAEKSQNAAEGIATNMLLKVVSKLLLPHDCESSDSLEPTPNYLLNSTSKRYELLEAFAGAFFPRLAYPPYLESKGRTKSHVYTSSVSNELESKIKQLASTAMGKTAAMLLTTLITQSAARLLDSSNDDPNKLHEKNMLLLLQMSSVLPIYLVAWGERLPLESGVILASFIATSRQWSDSLDKNAPMDNDSASPIQVALNDLCVGMRFALEVLYTSQKRKPSIFEALPEQVQKMCVGLIGLLKSPSTALTKSLSKICARSFARQSALTNSEDNVVISSNMSNYIMEVMHLLRKTMPMPNFLAFLIDSCGVEHATSSVPQPSRLIQDGETARDRLSEAVFSYDDAVAHLCHFLTTSCDGASTKVLPMIRPVLLKWLTSSTSTNDTTKQLVHARAAISILAAFTLDEILSHSSLQSKSDFIPPKFLDLDEKTDQLIVNCVIDQFELSARLWSMKGGDYMEDQVAQHQYLARLLGPITLLLRYRRGMFGQFIEELSGRVILQSQVEQKEKMSKSSGKDSPENKQGDLPSKKINVSEVHMKALLLVLKSKDPVSIVDLVRSSSILQTTLLSSTESIEKAVSGRHLAHLGSKLVYQAKLCKQ